ncbi:MAG: metal transporter [Deltaproteobacteria bacterium]|nr:metal transporter [Deltaproteobacteria bacterium]
MNEKLLNAAAEKTRAVQLYWDGVLKYFHDFVDSYWIAVNYFSSVEKDRLSTTDPIESIRDYADILLLNLKIAEEAVKSSQGVMNDYHIREFSKAFSAWLNTVFSLEGEGIDSLSSRQALLLEKVVHEYPRAIKAIRDEYGFHFDDGGYIKTAETDRFILYQVLPTNRRIKVRENGKPVIIIPPFVLGTNVLAFLPKDKKSYVHSFANQGIPTYIRIMRDIATTPAFQLMTGEDDARDTRFFCETVKDKHSRPVTLNGYCQGGFSSLCNILSGELDGLVDALITCVSPMDGTRSKGLATFLKNLPPRFNDLAYGTKTLPNGNKVADGKLMGWVYKLKAIQDEYPLVSFYRDIVMLQDNDKSGARFNKSALAVNYWLAYERNDLPLAITKMSFDSYNIPITQDGTLPVRLFGRELNLKRIPEKGIKWLICYGENDDLVEKETALAPLDYIDAEVTVFPKGHLAIATSWSNPNSEFALHKSFGEKNYRGPVLYQLDLDNAGKGK